MQILPRFLAAYARSGIRGSYRVTQFLADRFSSLQDFPVDTETGKLYVDLRISSSISLFANPVSEGGEVEVMRKLVRNGDRVFDIGAHLGFYTLLLAKLVGDTGKVFAFEPNPELLISLKKTVRGLANVQLFEAALSDQEGTMELFVPEDASMASISDWTDGIAGEVRRLQCEVKVIDGMIKSGDLEVPDFIKCDVEGAELSVFKGAMKTLDRVDAPIILFEVNELAATSFGSRIEEYFEILESSKMADYRLFRVEPDGIEPLISRYLTYANILAIPASRVGLIEAS